MPGPKIEIRSIRFPDELGEVVRGQHAAFGHATPSTPEALARVRRWRAARPGYHPRLQRVLTVRGRIVSGLLILDLRLRIGSAWVRCGGVGDVWTLPRHRKRGYATRLMNHCVDLMRREGFDVSLLFGIPDFYERFGYVTALPDHRVEMPTRGTLGPAPGWSVRRLRAGEVPLALRVHDRDARRRTGALRRSPPVWRYQDRSVWPGRFRSWAVLDRRRRLRGYVRLRLHAKDPVRLAEIGGLDTPEVVRTALAFAITRARKAGLRTVSAHLPPDERVLRWLRACGATVTTTYPLTGGGMVCILRLVPLLRRLRRDLEQRLAASPLANRAATAALVTDIGTAALAWSGNRLSIGAPRGRRRAQPSRPANLTIDLQRTALAPLMMGCCDSASAAARSGVALDANARRFLDILFPVGRPFVAWPDLF